MDARDRGRNRANMVGSRAAAAADDVDEAVDRELAEEPTRSWGCSSCKPNSFGSPAFG